MSEVHTYYWHDGYAHGPSGQRLNKCTWEEAQETCQDVARLCGLLRGETARILKAPPPQRVR